MHVYDYKGITKIHLCGDIHEDFDQLFRRIRVGGLTHDGELLKPTIHPYREEENTERLQHTEMIEDRFRIRDDAPNYMTFTDSILSRISDDGHRRKKKSKEAQYDNSLIICTGDCGFGTKSLEFYLELFGRVNEILSKNNCTLLMIRGNVDDPKYFDGEVINFSHIKAIPDYSVILTQQYNILCVGGAISIDRSWKKEQCKRMKGKTMYWENEAPILDHEKLNEIFQSGVRLHGVISHSAPSSIPVDNSDGLKYWATKDSNLTLDVQNERKTLEELFSILKQNKEEISWWIFGHFHQHAFHLNDKTNFLGIPTDGFLTSLDHELQKMKKPKLKIPNISSFSTWSAVENFGNQERVEEAQNPFDLQVEDIQVEDGPIEVRRGVRRAAF